MSSPMRIRSMSESRVPPFQTERPSRPVQRPLEPRHRSRSRASSTDSDIYHDASDSEQGMAPFIKNLSYGVHTALTKTSPADLKAADRVIKQDVHRGIDAALKHERMKMGTQIVSYLSGSHTVHDHDIPQLTPFNRHKEPCSEAEFERLFKNIQRTYPKYKGKSTELLYFLIEVNQLRQNNNITDNQLSRILTNRFEDRLLKYFLSEIKRGRDLLDVVNQIALDYVKTINPSQEVERYLSFTFKFDNLADELTELKQAISLAHPRQSHHIIQQKYLDKILSLLPYEQRHDLLDDLDQRDDMIRLGLVNRPYTEHELDNRILYHCRSLDRKNSDRRKERRVHKVRTRPPSPNWEENAISEEPLVPSQDLLLSVVTELKSLSNGIKQVSEQNSHQISQLINERKQQPFHQQLHTPPQQQQPLQQQRPFRRYDHDFRRHSPPPQQQQHRQQRTPSHFRPTSPPPTSFNDDQQSVSYKYDDPNYPGAVDQIKANGFRYLGQKITYDISQTHPRHREALREMRANRPTGISPYQWIDGKYIVHKSEQINFPIIRKRTNGPPDLTRDALEHFAKLCYACGKKGCQGRANSSTDCPYKAKPDSWLVCTNCKLGFPLPKDCLATVVEN